MALDLEDLLTEIRQSNPRLGLIFDRITHAVNQEGILTGTDPTQHTQPPNPPQALHVSSGSDHVHVTLTDDSKRSRALHYFVEWSANDPAFLRPQVEHLGVSRQRMLALPAKDGDGVPISYYFRAYSHYAGSRAPSAILTHGGTLNPAPVMLTGSSQLTPMLSTGSGTASTTGQEGGAGFGKTQFSRRGKPA